MKTLILPALAGALLAASPAAAVVTFSTAGDSHTIHMNGYADAYLGGATAIPGLLAELTFTLTGFSGQFANFDYAVKNVSVAPVTDSRVSIFGFDIVDANAVSGSTATGDYALVVRNNAGGFPNVGGMNRAFELCFKAGGGANNCSSGGGGGTGFGQTDTGTLSIKLGAAVDSIAFDNFGIRWQTLTAPSLNLNGASGVGDRYTPSNPDVPAVPEPATWALLIAGFGMVGSAMRRRKGLATVSA